VQQNDQMLLINVDVSVSALLFSIFSSCVWREAAC
jgi:hypothetical protein